VITFAESPCILHTVAIYLVMVVGVQTQTVFWSWPSIQIYHNVSKDNFLCLTKIKETNVSMKYFTMKLPFLRLYKHGIF